MAVALGISAPMLAQRRIAGRDSRLSISIRRRGAVRKMYRTSGLWRLRLGRRNDAQGSAARPTSLKPPATMLCSPCAERLRALQTVLAATIAPIRVAVQVPGGYRVMVEYEVERALRDAAGGAIRCGTSEMPRNTIGRWLSL